MTKSNIVGVGALILIAGVIGVIETSKPMQTRTDAQEIVLDENARTAHKEAQYQRAKEITTPDGFINNPEPGIDRNESFSIAEYIGEKVILVEFWTYSCVNCQRVIPYLNAWHTKYEDDGLIIIGIHTPEFEFEKDFENVQQAVIKYEVPWRVVLDNDYSTWRAYNNRYWPRKYLIDIDGFVVYDHIGEGAYDETEDKIVELLNERRAVLDLDGVVEKESGEVVGVQDVDFSKVKTRETYLGASRVASLLNLPRMSCLSSRCAYTYLENPLISGYELSGTWETTDEYTKLVSTTGALRIAFTASKVNIVGGNDTPVRARILIDGTEVTSAQTGTDVVDGIVTFQEEDLYNLIDLRGEYETHILEIQFLEPGAELFAFTFG